ncbi:MAG: conjugal transfer protein TraI [Sphingobacteriales bacterium]|nr:MAG: conjugal transfer protein TraI [Sphingobacteriales bacterium]
MKKTIAIALVTFIMVMSVRPPAAAQIPIIDIIKAAVKKVIRQIDLRVQKLQNKTIALQNAQKALENTLSRTKLKEISDWSEKQRKLYEDYYDELKKVKALISGYQSVCDIVRQQASIVSEYRQSYQVFAAQGNFTQDELRQMQRIYQGILDESVRNLDQLLVVSSAGKTSMSDGERLEQISTVAAAMQRNYDDLRTFNNQNRLLSIRRGAERQDINRTRKLYQLSTD